MFSADRSWRVCWLFINSYVGSYSRTLQRLPCSRSAAVKTSPASFDPPPPLTASAVTLKADKSCLWMNGSIRQTRGSHMGHWPLWFRGLSWLINHRDESVVSILHFVGSQTASSSPPPPFAPECLSWSNRSYVITFTASFSLSLLANSWMTNFPQIRCQHWLSGFA